MDNIKKTWAEKLTDIDNRNPLRLWFTVYGGLFLLAIILAFVSAQVQPSFIFESNSVRYILSALIQSQAAVISIVVTLTLVAVQWTASTYSPRVVEVFKRHPNMWLLLGFYIISIGFCTLLLSLIKGDVSSIFQRFGVFFAMYLGIFLFIALIPYIFNTMNLLNAEKILIRLLGLIKVSKLRAEEDPFQAPFDIIYGAIRNYDMTTMSTGLVLARDKFEDIIGDTNEDKRYILFRYFDDIKRCGLLLIERNEEKFVFEIITRLKDLGEWAIKNNEMGVLDYVNTTLQEVGGAATGKNHGSAVNHAITTLEELLQSLRTQEKEEELHKNTQTVIEFIDSISIIGQKAVLSEMDDSVSLAIRKINKLWREYEEKEQSQHLPLLPKFLAIARSAVSSHVSRAEKYIDSAFSSIEHMGIFFLEIGNEDAVIEIMAEVKGFARLADAKGDKEAVLRSSEAILYICDYARSRDPRSIIASVAAKYLVLLDSMCPYINDYKNLNHSRYQKSVSFTKNEYYADLYKYLDSTDYCVGPQDDDNCEDYYEDDNVVIIFWSDRYPIENTNENP